MRKRNSCKFIEVSVLSNDILCIANYSTINELIIVNIALNKFKVEMSINAHNIISTHYSFNNNPCSQWRHLVGNNLFVFLKNLC